MSTIPSSVMDRFFPDRGVPAVRRMMAGATDEKWLVRLGESKYVVRCVAGHRASALLRSEHEALRRLNQSAFPYRVPVPLRSSAHSSVVAAEGKSWWAYEFIAGETGLVLDGERVVVAGRALALFHDEIDGWSPAVEAAGGESKRRRWLFGAVERSLDDPRAALLRDARYRLYRRLAVAMLSSLAAAARAEHRDDGMLWIHGDWSADNLVWRSGELFGVLDFGNSHYACREADVAQVLYQDLVVPPCSTEAARAREFLRAYRACSRKDLLGASSIVEHVVWCAVDSLWWSYWQLRTGSGEATVTQKKLRHIYGVFAWYQQNGAALAEFLDA